MSKSRNFLPYGRQSIEEADIAAVDAVLRDDWITQGPRIEAFEHAVAKRVGAAYGVAVSSGTGALHSACIAAGLTERADAIVPVLTFAATAAAVRLTGAEVRFVDIEPDTWCISPSSVEQAVTEHTKAILPVDFAGQPCNWDSLSDLSRSLLLTTIADSAHALGAEYEGRPVGSLADMTCFSFHPVKAITTAEGGMTTTNRAVFEERLRRVRNHGIVRDFERFEGGEAECDIGSWSYEVQELGLNYRISDIQCALGISQLERLDGFVSRRRELAALYSSMFSECELLSVPNAAARGSSAWHIYVIRLNLKALAQKRRYIFDELKARGLGVQVHYKPLHLHPYYSKRYGLGRGDFPIAEDYYDSALTLPLFPAMTEQDVADVVEIVTDVLSACRR